MKPVTDEKNGNGRLKGKEMWEKKQRDLRTVRNMLGIVLIFALGSAVTTLAAAPVDVAELVLDRLFYSPQERSVLEMLRKASNQPALPSVEQLNEKDDVQEKPQIFTLGGTVTGKNGVQGVWLNGQQYPFSGLPVNVEVQKPYAAGEVILQVEGKNTLYTLRAGQTLYLEDDRIREPYEQQLTPSSVSPVVGDEATVALPGPEPGPVGGVTDKP